MKQETTTVEIGTDNSAQETLMGALIGMTGGMTGALAEMNGGVETLGTICESVLGSTSSIFSIGQMSNASLVTIAEGSGSSVGLLGQMTDGITQLVIASDMLCDGVLKLVENTAQSEGGGAGGILGVASSLGSVASGMAGINDMAKETAGLKNVADLGGKLAGGVMSLVSANPMVTLVIAAGITAILAYLAWKKTRDTAKEKAEEAARNEEESQPHDAAAPNAYLERYGDSMGAQPQAAAPSGDGGVSQVGSLPQTMTSGMITIQEATLQNLSLAVESLSLTPGTLSLAPETVNLTVDSLNVAVQGTSSFVFQQGVNFGLGAPDLGRPTVWGEPMKARAARSPMVPAMAAGAGTGAAREARKYITHQEARLEAEMARESGARTGTTSRHASGEDGPSGQGKGTNGGNTQNSPTFSQVIHMNGVNISSEYDIEEIGRRLADMLVQAVERGPHKLK